MSVEASAGIEELAETLTAFLRETQASLRRRGAVVGVSGGIDSAVTLALCARALGPERVLAVAIPERESSAATTELATSWAQRLGAPYIVCDITDALEALGCYRLRDEAVKELIPDYEPGKDRLAVQIMQGVRENRMPAWYKAVVSKASGEVVERRMTSKAYRAIFAASNHKQRLRTVTLYHHAELRDATVIGTSNLDEEYLGFFVKIGDGTWDACPIESLTKTTVRALAAHLGVPDEITGRPTTTDTFPVDEQPQEEMFYCLPFEQLDPLLEVLVGRRSVEEAVAQLGWSEDEVHNALHNLGRRHRSTVWNRTMGLRPGLEHPVAADA